MEFFFFFFLYQESLTQVEEVDESEIGGENGMQEFHQIVIEPYEEEPASVQPDETDDITEIEETVYEQIDQETQEVPELEAPPPPVVSNNPPSAPIMSTLRVKEPSQMMVYIVFNFYTRGVKQLSLCLLLCTSVTIKITSFFFKLQEAVDNKIITIEENSIDTMLQTEFGNAEDDAMNGGSINENENQIIDFQEVMDNIEATDIVLAAAAKDAESVDKVLQEHMEVDQNELSDSVAIIEPADEDNCEVALVEEATIEKQEDVEEAEDEDDTKKTEPDTEAVSEDEFPTEATAKVILNINLIIYFPVSFDLNHLYNPRKHIKHFISIFKTWKTCRKMTFP